MSAPEFDPALARDRARPCLPHDDLTEQTLQDGVFVCAACGRPDGIEQPPAVEGGA